MEVVHDKAEILFDILLEPLEISLLFLFLLLFGISRGLNLTLLDFELSKQLLE